MKFDLIPVHLKEIDFEEILPYWQNFLWPDRQSAIETHSSIIYNTHPYEYDSSYFNNKPTFIGAFYADKLIGVNSGHLTGNEYRSRGLFVLPEYRKLGVGKMLLSKIIEKGHEESANFCWSMPRKSSIKTYLSVGFNIVGEWFETETSMENVYVRTVE